MTKVICMNCDATLKKDHIALSKKLLGRHIIKFMCLNCLAEYIDCTVEDLLVKIEEFREQGCSLFK